MNTTKETIAICRSTARNKYSSDKGRSEDVEIISQFTETFSNGVGVRYFAVEFADGIACIYSQGINTTDTTPRPLTNVIDGAIKMRNVAKKLNSICFNAKVAKKYT